jgi:hypothetical protein
MPAATPSPGVSVFEVDLGPSTLSLMLTQLANVNYLDIPVILLMLVHAASFVLFLVYRQNLLVSSIHFLCCCYCIFITDSLNDFFAARWPSFLFSENYFDESCIFLFVFWSAPIAVVAGLIILNLFADLCKSVAVHRYFNAIVPKDRPARATPADGKTKHE